MHPDANPAIHGLSLYSSQTVRNKQIYRLLGKVPTIAAAVYRHRSGRCVGRWPPTSFSARHGLTT